MLSVLSLWSRPAPCSNRVGRMSDMRKDDMMRTRRAASRKARRGFSEKITLNQ
jgi:hypothetical protein